MQSDKDFVESFERGEIPNEGFHHISHIRMAWYYLRLYGIEDGSRRIIEGIRHFAAKHNLPHLYHQTITLFWIAAVNHCLQQTAENISEFSQFIGCYPHLSDKNSIYRFYSRDHLMSDAARQTWVLPDLREFPAATV